MVPDFPPLDHAATRPFWRAAADGALALPACPVCGTWQWYPLAGLACHPDATAGWRTLPGDGTVFTFSRVFRAFLPSGGDPPYTVALIDLDGVADVRLVSTLVGAGSEDPAVGDRVRLAPTRFATHTLPTFEIVPAQRSTE